MKLVFIAVTTRGAALAQRLGDAFSGDIFVKEGRWSGGFPAVRQYSVLSELIAEIFSRYDGFVFIMATGIVVRVIAPHLIHKTSDPAVVTMDEAGRFAISLVSGHIGGANDLAQQLAAFSGAIPVITTATDVNGKIAADLVALRLGMRMEPSSQIKYINAEIAEGHHVRFFIDKDMARRSFYEERLKLLEMDFELISLADAQRLSESSVLLTDRRTYVPPQCQLVLRPRKLTIGIGCRKGTAASEISYAVAEACASVDKTMGDIANLASSAVKRNETGLLSFAEQLGVPLTFYENKTLQEVIDAHRLAVSEFVRTQIGIGNVCEAAALLRSQSKKLILAKTKYPKVTVAIAWEK